MRKVKMSAPPALPDTAPPVTKQQIYKNPRFFKYVDDHVLSIVKEKVECFQKLMWQLAYQKCFNELERARAIFRWMTLKDVHEYGFTGRYNSMSCEVLLQKIKDGTTKPAVVFERMAILAGLNCVIVSGWIKDIYYRPGIPVTAEPANHSWNAVQINGDWRFIDCEIACKYPDEYDDFYFIPDPKEFIYSHFPEDPVWQLIKPPRSKVEFEDYPLVKPEFFKFGMQLRQQNQGEIYTHKGILVLPLTLQQQVYVTYNFNYGPDNEEIIDDVPLKRYVLQETIPLQLCNENDTDDDVENADDCLKSSYDVIKIAADQGNQVGDTKTCRVNFFVRAPHTGIYYLTIYACSNKEKEETNSTYKLVCEYKIICDETDEGIQPFPICHDCGWGFGRLAEKFGLSFSGQVEGHIATYLFSNKVTEITIGKTNRLVQLHMFLKKDGLSEGDLKSAVSQCHEDEEIICVHFYFPVCGEYVLEIYASGPPIGGDIRQLICQFLVIYSDRNQNHESVYGKAKGYRRGIFRYNYPLDQYEALDLIYQESLPQDSLDTSDFSDVPSTSESPIHHSPLMEASPPGKFKCPICLEDDKELRKDGKQMMCTTCGHLFCETCIDMALLNQHKCPTCEASLKRNNIHPIYF